MALADSGVKNLTGEKEDQPVAPRKVSASPVSHTYPAGTKNTPGQFDDAAEGKDKAQIPLSNQERLTQLFNEFDDALKQKDVEKAVIHGFVMTRPVYLSLIQGESASTRRRAIRLVSGLFNLCESLLQSDRLGKEMILIVLGRLPSNSLDSDQKQRLKQWQQQYCQLKDYLEAPVAYDMLTLPQLTSYTVSSESLIDSERLGVIKKRYTRAILELLEDLGPSETLDARWTVLLTQVFPFLHLIEKGKMAGEASCHEQLQKKLVQILGEKINNSDGSTITFSIAEEYSAIMRYCEQRGCLQKEQRQKFERVICDKLSDNDKLPKAQSETLKHKQAKLLEKLQILQGGIDNEELLEQCLLSRQENMGLWFGDGSEELCTYLKQALTIKISQLCLMASCKGVDAPDYHMQLKNLVVNLGNLFAKPWVIGHYPHVMLNCLWQNTIYKGIMPNIEGQLAGATRESLDCSEALLKWYKSMLPPQYLTQQLLNIEEARRNMRAQKLVQLDEKFGQQEVSIMEETKQQEERGEEKGALEFEQEVKVSKVTQRHKERKIYQPSALAKRGQPLSPDISENYLKVIIGNKEKKKEVGSDIYINKKYETAWKWLDLIWNYYQTHPLPDNTFEYDNLVNFSSNIIMTVMGGCFNRTSSLRDADPDARRKGSKQIAKKVRDYILPFMQMFPDFDPQEQDEQRKVVKTYNDLCSAIYKVFLFELYEDYEKKKGSTRTSVNSCTLGGLEKAIVALHPWFYLLNKKSREATSECYMNYFFQDWTHRLEQIRKGLESTENQKVMEALRMIDSEIIKRHRFFEEPAYCNRVGKVMAHAMKVIEKLEQSQDSLSEELKYLKDRILSVYTP